MLHRPLAVAVAAAAVLTATLVAPCDAADSAAPLRTLVYHVRYSAHTQHDKRTSGFNGAYGNGVSSGPSSVTAGNGTASVGMDGNDDGTLTVDVIAATADGGLVVDTSYSGSLSAQPKVRVALFSDGRLSADPHVQLGPETTHLLPLLARGFIAGHDVSPGATWTSVPPPPAHGSYTYRVSHFNGSAAQLAYDGALSLAGVNGFDETDRGTATYDVHLLTPMEYDLTAHVRRQIGTDETITTDAHWTMTKIRDTFAP